MVAVYVLPWNDLLLAVPLQVQHNQEAVGGYTGGARKSELGKLAEFLRALRVLRARQQGRLAEHRLPCATHMRNEDDRLMEAVNEAIAVASGAGCLLQISR